MSSHTEHSKIHLLLVSQINVFLSSFSPPSLRRVPYFSCSFSVHRFQKTVSCLCSLTAWDKSFSNTNVMVWKWQRGHIRHRLSLSSLLPYFHWYSGSSHYLELCHIKSTWSCPVLAHLLSTFARTASFFQLFHLLTYFGESWILSNMQVTLAYCSAPQAYAALLPLKR